MLSIQPEPLLSDQVPDVKECKFKPKINIKLIKPTINRTGQRSIPTARTYYFQYQYMYILKV